ncbi:MAG: PIN domain-containing protein [Spirochaetaceae bacterium]|nr:PIN domain-containing protein [Spirochaetaceae bacterium]
MSVRYPFGKSPLPFTPEELVYHLKNVSNLTIQPVDERIWLKNVSLDWEHKDSADRTIVATAALRGIPIVSSDRAIRDFYSRTIW